MKRTPEQYRWFDSHFGVHCTITGSRLSPQFQKMQIESSRILFHSGCEYFVFEYHKLVHQIMKKNHQKTTYHTNCNCFERYIYTTEKLH